MRAIYLLLIIFMFCINHAYAASPLPQVVQPDIQMLQNKPILYRYDPGKLGPLTNEEAISIVEEAIKKWESISTAMIDFVRDDPGFLDKDIDASNYISTKVNQNNYATIIFDDNGSILKGGGGGVPWFSYGRHIGGSVVLSGKYLQEAYLVKEVSPSSYEYSLNHLRYVVLHELGHLLGIDHSQDDFENSNGVMRYSPTNNEPLIYPDDISAASLLYPNPDELRNYGRVEGRIVGGDRGTNYPGVNVVLININEPKKSISCVSGYIPNGIGTKGLFTFVAVPPGDYILGIEPINPKYFGIEMGLLSTYTSLKDSFSFTNPPPRGYYVNNNDPITEDKNKASIIRIYPGAEIKDIRIIGSKEIVYSFVSNITDEYVRFGVKSTNSEFPIYWKIKNLSGGFNYPYMVNCYASKTLDEKIKDLQVCSYEEDGTKQNNYFDYGKLNQADQASCTANWGSAEEGQMYTLWCEADGIPLKSTKGACKGNCYVETPILVSIPTPIPTPIPIPVPNDLIVQSCNDTNATKCIYEKEPNDYLYYGQKFDLNFNHIINILGVTSPIDPSGYYGDSFLSSNGPPKYNDFYEFNLEKESEISILIDVQNYLTGNLLFFNVIKEGKNVVDSWPLFIEKNNYLYKRTLSPGKYNIALGAQKGTLQYSIKVQLHEVLSNKEEVTESMNDNSSLRLNLLETSIYKGSASFDGEIQASNLISKTSCTLSCTNCKGIRFQPNFFLYPPSFPNDNYASKQIVRFYLKKQKVLNIYNKQGTIKFNVNVSCTNGLAVSKELEVEVSGLP